MRLCPDCKQPMTATDEGGAILDACAGCAGIWFDDGEIRRVMQTDQLALLQVEDRHEPSSPPSSPSSPSSPSTPTARRCPDCDRVLDRYRYLYDSPVQLDMCGTCGGVWAEDGELRKMQDWLDGTMGARRVTPGRWTPDQEKELARAIAVHEKEMGRQRMLYGIFSVLGKRRR